MNTKTRKYWNTGLHLDGVANAVVLGAGIVVVLLAATSTGVESAIPERIALQAPSGAPAGTKAPA